MERIHDKERAYRFARLLFEEIYLYNEEKLRQSLLKDTFFDLFAEEIESAKKLYGERVDPALKERESLFNQALIDSLFERGRKIKTPNW